MKSSRIVVYMCIVLALSVMVGVTSCTQTYSPQPYAYFRIDLPEQNYVCIDSLGPYTIEINEICRVNSLVVDSMALADEWYNIEYPTLNANIHLSYKSVTKATFRTISEECHDLAYKHTIRANAISEDFYADTTTAVYGIYYQMEGEAASQAQFFMTDSTHHFLRGSLYFNNTPNADSIAPVSTYIQNDIIHLIETLRWK